MAGFDLASILSALSGGKQQAIVPNQPISPVSPELPALPAVAPVVPTADTIFGLSPDQFSVVAGGIAEALAPKGSFQQQLGAFAGGLGKGGITEEALKVPVAGATLKKKPAKSKLQDKVDLSNTLLGE